MVGSREDRRTPRLRTAIWDSGCWGRRLRTARASSYADLVSGITEPLGMHDTVLHLSPEQRARLIQGYAGAACSCGHHGSEALAGAGAIRSTAADLLRYLTANLHPETVSGSRTGFRRQSKNSTSCTRR